MIQKYKPVTQTPTPPFPVELVRTYVADENKIEGPTKKFILSKKKEVTKNRGTYPSISCGTHR